MGTGLGPESYAIIGQERIGQLLSSKPHDRRAIIEEAAGITRFKTKKRLAELRLEAAKQNLARVDDIFEEVTRQMNSPQAPGRQGRALRRSPRRAARPPARRPRQPHGRRWTPIRRASTPRSPRSPSTSTPPLRRSANMEAGQHSLTERGYELDAGIQEAQARANYAAVELERAAARERGNTERVAELEARIAAAAAELEQTRTQLAGIVEERAQQHSFLADRRRRSPRLPSEGRRAPAGSPRRRR